MPRGGGFQNLDQVMRTYEQHAERVQEALRIGLENEAKGIMERSQQLVPRETGELAESAFIDPARDDGHGLAWVALGYTAGHAAAVHERLDQQHAEGKSAKYLQRAVDESISSGMTRRIAGRLERVLRRR